VTGSLAVLTNPTAGRGRYGDVLDEVLERLRAAGRPVQVLTPATADQVPGTCRAALDGGAGALVAVGGDGTVHLALQALAGTGVPFGIVPAGTGNDIAANFGLPAQPVAAATAAAEALRTGHSRTFDLGRAELADGTVRWFAGVLGAGFDAIVNERANAMRYPKGPRRYDVAILAEMLRLHPRAYAIGLDGTTRRLNGVLVAIANTGCYGGGYRICPAADPHDGLLDVMIGGEFSRAGLLRILPRVRAGSHLGHPLVESHQAGTVRVDAEGIVAYADGERIGPLPLTATCVPGALTLLVP
jgi:diacylglycerol kinase (ATP)